MPFPKGNCLLDSILEQVAVGEPRKLVVAALIFQFLFIAPPLCDVAKVPNPPVVCSIGRDHRRREAIDYATVFKRELIFALFIPVLIQIFEPCDEGLLVRQLVHHRLQKINMMFREYQVDILKTPYVEKALIARYSVAVFVDNQDAIQRSFLLGRKDYVSELQFFFGLLALSDVSETPH